MSSIAELQMNQKMKKRLEIVAPFFGIVSGFIMGGILLLLQGVNPISAYAALFSGSLVGWLSISEMLIKAIPLALAGLAVCFSYRTGFFNIGAEGQLYFGAIGGALIAINFPSLPGFIHIPLAIIVGAIFGGLLALIPGILRAYRDVNEIVTTMLLNYVAGFILSMLVEGPMKEAGSFYPRSVQITETATLSRIFDSNLHTGIFFVIPLAFILYWFFKKTAYGLDMEIAGGNKRALTYSGISEKKMIIQIMLISGMIAGTAGVLEVLGVHGRLIEKFSVGLGYEAIAVALLANLNPVGTLISAVFFAILKNGASTMQIATGVPEPFIKMVQAMIILFVIVFSVFPRVMYNIRKKREMKNGRIN